MLNYNLLKKLLFSMQPETAHAVACRFMQLGEATGLSKLIMGAPISKPVTCMGLNFLNPVGLAAGFDKNADHIDALAALGFGFIEVGTITPKPQDGNPKPRLFRLPEHEAIINRMGFNNKGIAHAEKQLEKTRYRGVLGINVGKNFSTPLDKATDDYVAGFRSLWQYASYMTINISSPNTPGLRDLHQEELLIDLLRAMKHERDKVKNEKYVPLVVKVSPDMSDEQTIQTADIILREKMDGVIATNTTVAREAVAGSPFAQEQGGLSGKPLLTQSTHTVSLMHNVLKDDIPIIAAGGIMDAASAKQKLAAGAKLVQLYTGFIYKGPRLVSEILTA